MKKILKNRKILISLFVTALLLPAAWLLVIEFSLPEGEIFQIVQQAPANSLLTKAFILILTPVFLLFDFALAAVAFFFIYTMMLNIPPLLKKEIELPWFIQIVLVASLSSSFCWYALKETPRLLFEITETNVPYHRVILSPENKFYLVHDLLGVRKNYSVSSLTAISGKCLRTDRPGRGEYNLEYTFEVGLELDKTIYLTNETQKLKKENPAYAIYQELARLAKTNDARLNLTKCPHIDKFPPGLYPTESITTTQPWKPPS